MANSSILKAVVSVAVVACATSSLFAGSGRPNSVEKFGIGGYIQPIGLHHGFHIERITPDSPAEKDKLRPHDVIVKVDGEAIRNLDHLRALIAEAYADNGEVTITYLRGTSLTHHDLLCKLKKAPTKVARKPKIEESDDDVEIRKAPAKAARKPKIEESDDDVEIR